eukprot:GHVR01015883.1.p2 GENE.GHVR01015883.1~~GHVR01015883.1.p2  ORF type:complete len:147 (+),score=91.13 GHVR01015883.1:113-553(+)
MGNINLMLVCVCHVMTHTHTHTCRNCGRGFTKESQCRKHETSCCGKARKRFDVHSMRVCGLYLRAPRASLTECVYCGKTFVDAKTRNTHTRVCRGRTNNHTHTHTHTHQIFQVMEVVVTKHIMEPPHTQQQQTHTHTHVIITLLWV